MKVIRKNKGTPSGSSLFVSVLYGTGDIKDSLIKIKKRIGKNESVSMKDLILMLYDVATDIHMQKEPRLYIAEWMARRAVVEGFIFRTDDYLGNACNGSDMYLIDEESIRERMRGRKPQKIK